MIVAMILVAAVGAVAYFWIGHQWQAWSKKKADIVNVEKRIYEAKKNIDDANKQSDTLDDIRSGTEEMESKLPTGDILSWLIAEFGRIASRYQLKPPEVQTSSSLLYGKKGKDDKSSPTPGYKVLAYKVLMVGDYHKCGMFVRDVENEYPLFEISKLEVLGDPKDPKEQKVTFTVEVLTLEDKPKIQPEKPQTTK